MPEYKGRPNTKATRIVITPRAGSLSIGQLGVLMNEKRLTRHDEEAKGPVMERTGKVVDSEALEIKDYNDQERARSQRIMEMSRKRSWLQTY